MKYANFPPYVEVFLLEDINAIQVKWTELHLSLDKFKEVMATTHKMFSIHKCSIWIADQYNSKGAYNKEIISFITDELVEDTVTNYGVNLVLTIMPKKKGVSSLSTKRWMGDIEEMGVFKMANFSTIEACKEWIIQENAK